MIRRWSRVNKSNNIDFNNYFFDIRFNVRKLVKAINFKKFLIGYSKFKRIKLAIFHRRRSWLPYYNIVKMWIWDYEFTKKIVRSQYINNIFMNAFFVFDYRYNQKQNPLTFDSNRDFILNGLVKKFYSHCYNLRHPPTPLFQFNFIKNTVFTVAYFPDKNFNFLEHMESNNTTVPSLFRTENFFFWPTHPKRRISKILLTSFSFNNFITIF